MAPTTPKSPAASAVNCALAPSSFFTTAFRKAPKSVPGVIVYYAKRSLARYGGLARYLRLLAAPAAAAVLLIGTLLFFRSLTPA